MEIRIIKQPITRAEVSALAQQGFGRMVKAVVDVKQAIMAIGGELHVDGDTLLATSEGSEREDTWGINLYPDRTGDEFVEFNSMINIKPAHNNRSRSVEDRAIQATIREIVARLVI